MRRRRPTVAAPRPSLDGLALLRSGVRPKSGQSWFAPAAGATAPGGAAGAVAVVAADGPPPPHPDAGAASTRTTVAARGTRMRASYRRGRLPRRGRPRRPDLRRAARARIAAREAAHDARPVPVVAQRAAAGVQPIDEPRAGGRLRRGHHPRGAPRARTPAVHATGERPHQPRVEVPAPARRRPRGRPR